MLRQVELMTWGKTYAKIKTYRCFYRLCRDRRLVRDAVFDLREHSVSPDSHAPHAPQQPDFFAAETPQVSQKEKKKKVSHIHA